MEERPQSDTGICVLSVPLKTCFDKGENVLLLQVPYFFSCRYTLFTI